tara:strand:+ start:417 stop:611 length:195 start_codon:yes stop_codon:yes gene_type:complete
MNKKDARTRTHNSVLESEQYKHKEKLSSAEKKWEFRYNNQDKRIKALEATVKKLRAKIKELKND